MHDYLIAHSSPTDQVLTSLAEETQRRFPDRAKMQIGPEQGTFMTLVARLTGARPGHRDRHLHRLLFHSGIARGLCQRRPADPAVTSARSGPRWPGPTGRRPGLADRIELRLGPARSARCARCPPRRQFDLAFIDADKGGYIGYWDEILRRMKPGGAGAWWTTRSPGGGVTPPAPARRHQAIRNFNDHAVADDRVDLVMLPIGDARPSPASADRCPAGPPPGSSGHPQTTRGPTRRTNSIAWPICVSHHRPGQFPDMPTWR